MRMVSVRFRAYNMNAYKSASSSTAAFFAAARLAVAGVFLGGSGSPSSDLKVDTFSSSQLCKGYVDVQLNDILCPRTLTACSLRLWCRGSLSGLGLNTRGTVVLVQRNTTRM